MAVYRGSLVTAKGSSCCFMEAISKQIIGAIAAKATLILRRVSSAFKDGVFHNEVVIAVVFPSAVNTWTSTEERRTAPCLCARIKLSFHV